MPGPLVPEDDLYARLEVAVDASPEAIELAWRALLKLHHPDVAGDCDAALERAKRINVAHDWLSDPGLRARYDRERLGIGGRTGVRHGRPPRRPAREPAGPAPRPDARRTARPPERQARTDLFHGEAPERLATFLARVSRLSADELDRLAAAEPPPIAFLATIRRFLSPEARRSFAAAESALAAVVPRERWAAAGLREGLLGVAAELVLTPFLDDLLAEPFRGRARERLLRAWDASVDQARHGPNAAHVAAMRARLAAMTPAEINAFVRASAGIAAGDRPWPAALDPDEDEALRISAVLAARDAAASIPVDGVPATTAARARRLAARLGHVVALHHAFPRATYEALLAPLVVTLGETPAAAPRARVRRRR